MSHQPAAFHIIVCVLGATAAKYVLPQCDYTDRLLAGVAPLIRQKHPLLTKKQTR